MTRVRLHLIAMAAIPFPPSSVADIEAYDSAEVLAGFMEFSEDDPFPGENRSPAYRWGWQNAFRDRSSSNDGYDAVRHEYARWRYAAHALAGVGM